MKMLLILAVIVTSVPAFAYIDPGTGGMLLQLLLGGVAGIAMIGKLYWRHFLEKWNQLFRRTSAAPEASVGSEIVVDTKPE